MHRQYILCGQPKCETPWEFNFTTTRSSRNVFRTFAQNWRHLIPLNINSLWGIAFESLETNLKMLFGRVPLANWFRTIFLLFICSITHLLIFTSLLPIATCFYSFNICFYSFTSRFTLLYLFTSRFMFLCLCPKTWHFCCNRCHSHNTCTNISNTLTPPPPRPSSLHTYIKPRTRACAYQWVRNIRFSENWRALFSRNTHFEIRSFAWLPTLYRMPVFIFISNINKWVATNMTFRRYLKTWTFKLLIQNKFLHSLNIAGTQICGIKTWILSFMNHKVLQYISITELNILNVFRTAALHLNYYLKTETLSEPCKIS